MAYEIIKSSKGRVTLRVTGATTGLVLDLVDFRANTTVAQNTQVESIETVTALTLTRAYWAVANTGYWKISRASESVLELGFSGVWNLIEGGHAVANNSTGNVEIDLVGTTNGSLILEFSKQATYSPDPVTGQ